MFGFVGCFGFGNVYDVDGFFCGGIDVDECEWIGCWGVWLGVVD